MKVLIHIAPDPRHLEASFPLARAFAARGHEVIYSASSQMCAAIEARGFRCLPIHRNVWGCVRPLQPGDDERDLDAVTAAQQIADEYLGGVIDDHVAAIDPAFVIADARASSPLQLVAHALGIPCLQLSWTFSQHLDRHPPLVTSLLPDASRLELAGARWLASCLHPSTAPFRVPMLLSAMADRYAARFAYPVEGVSFETVFGPAFVRIPEMIASPAAIDFPGSDPSSHAALPVELEHEDEIPPELARLTSATGVIVASLGETTSRATHAGRFVDAVIEAARRRPDRHFVLIATDRLREIVRAAPANVIWVARAPRVWLLRRAVALVSHGDLLEIREAIALHVPIVVVAQLPEYLGNAARISYHGLGATLAASAMTAEKLLTTLDTITGSPAVRHRLAEVDAACRREQAEHRAVTVMEALARGHAARRVSRPPPCDPVRSGWLLADPASERVRALASGQTHVAQQGLVPHRSLGDALACADGSLLLRVEQVGEITSDGVWRADAHVVSRWQHDIAVALRDYALWCAETALEPAIASIPDRVAVAKDLIAQYREATRTGRHHRIAGILDRALLLSSRSWHSGFGAVALAMSGSPARGAQMARFEAISSLARNTPGMKNEAYRETYHRIKLQLDRDLEHRVHRTSGHSFPVQCDRSERHDLQ